MSISGVLNRLSNYHTHLAKQDFLQLRFDYLIPHPTLICPKTITLFFVYELIYVIYLTRLKVFANYLHLLYSNLLIIRLIRNKTSYYQCKYVCFFPNTLILIWGDPGNR